MAWSCVAAALHLCRVLRVFNKSYVQVLTDWQIVTEGLNPVARTNIAPEIAAPAAPSLYGFSYTVPSSIKMKTFIVAGGGELPEGSLDPHDVIRRGEDSAEALREKVRFVMGLMSRRLKDLGVSWNVATNVNIYTVHPIAGLFADEIIKPMGASGIHGATWHYSRGRRSSRSNTRWTFADADAKLC